MNPGEGEMTVPADQVLAVILGPTLVLAALAGLVLLVVLRPQGAPRSARHRRAGGDRRG